MPKKETDYDKLARQVAKGFEEMVTREDVRRNTERLLHAIDGLELKMSAYASSWKQDFDRLHEWVKGIDERLTFIEKQDR